LDLNELYRFARDGGKSEEKEFFSALSEIFRILLFHKVQDRQDAEEIIQDVLAVVAQKYRDIEFTVSFSSWVHAVLKNRVMNYYRFRKTESSRFDRSENARNAEGSHRPNPELERRIVECFRKLHEFNKNHARILNLRYQGYGIKELCKKLNMSANGIYIVLSRARAVLKKCLDDGEIS